MLFNSWQFLFVFLPISFFVYFFLNARGLFAAGKVFLVGCSLFFYAYWDVSYLPIIVTSLFFNYAVGTGLTQAHPENLKKTNIKRHELNRKVVLIIGILSNVLLLGYYKYYDFFITNINVLIGSSYDIKHIILPLGISFFTFQQIAYLVDSYNGETSEYNFVNYALFVTFFPQLIAGPIVHHHEMMSQFNSKWRMSVRYSYISRGLFIFAIGLFKKVVIADSFSFWANNWFDGNGSLSFFEGWAASLSYTFQLYYDFSGYCDMAIGLGLLFNIKLPLNFYSPYKSLDIQDFWRRWHITLGRFLRDYIYIPLGGSKNKLPITCCNLFITFLIGGLWHGASWMFVIWGAMHGGALIVHRLWRELGFSMPKWIAWFTTFLFVNITWVFFRAHDLSQAKRVLSAMVDVSSIYSSADLIPTSSLAWAGTFSDYLVNIMPASLISILPVYIAIMASFALIFCNNSIQLSDGKVTRIKAYLGALLFAVAICFSLGSKSSVFLYFNF